MKLPIGIQSFVVIREENYRYVDKTMYVKKLVDDGKFFFLSRPRRFGKSLFLDTLRQAFLGKRELFKGLFLENNWDWSRKYPVIYISFGAGVTKDPSILEKRMLYMIDDHAKEYDVKLEKEVVPDRFLELIEKLYKKHSEKVVILVDEYDKPILDNIEDTKTAVQMRELLKNFYSVIKDADPYLKFVFITGVTKFSNSIFSGLNNLKDITLNPKYATICGITQEELEYTFKDLLEDVDKEQMKRWYNGYNFLGEKLYNPFDVLLFLDSKMYRPYWFETGTPTFLIKLLMKERYYIPFLENLQVGDEILESFDVENIQPEVLLFQTGYLTIRDVQEEVGMNVYTLTYPNLEVKSAFNRHLLNYFTNLREKDKNMINLVRALKSSDVDKMKEIIQSFFASILSDWYRKNDISRYEGFYASVFYAYFAALGVEVRAEDATSRGRIDLSVMLDGKCFIFEFKVVDGGSEESALRQLKERRYHEKYATKCDEIYLIGVEFDKDERNIVNFEWEKLNFEGGSR